MTVVDSFQFNYAPHFPLSKAYLMWRLFQKLVVIKFRWPSFIMLPLFEGGRQSTLKTMENQLRTKWLLRIIEGRA